MIIFRNGGSSLAGVVLFRHALKSIEADKRLRAQQSRQSGQQCGLMKKEVSFKAQKWRFLPTGMVMLRNALKFLDSIGQKSDKRLRAQQSGEQCGPVELKKEEDSFKAQPSPPSVGSKTANKNVQIQFGSVDDKIWEQIKNRLTTQKQQPSPPSISSQTGQQTEKQVPSLR
ncbi:hypothetical protein AAFF_G00191560 [Aldrovandia affinis]|uniref:Uncharacterized protein n=1 Tax=Aldrovandia affinis TaxID=143900 RepID=A0AAD7R046_9TELE|nr:hypothetical protein AAFF_G00191560 [Aldrovandia affinis]